MRASVLALGPLLARFGKAKVSLPGGCAIGTRPIDLHLVAFEKLGAEVRLEAGNVIARAPKGGRLIGGEIHFDKVTVTGTENVMMAATLARGMTVIHNAACEPEINDLAELLNKMGARVRGAGTSQIEIEGVEELGSARTHDHSRSHRNRNLHRRRRDHQWRSRNQRLRTAASLRSDRQVSRGRRRDRRNQSEHAARLLS